MEGIVRRFWMLRPTQRGSQAGRTTYDGQASANQARSGEKKHVTKHPARTSSLQTRVRAPSSDLTRQEWARRLPLMTPDFSEQIPIELP